MDYSESDREFWEEELADFVPQRVFDAHCHLFDGAHMRPDAPATTRSYADLETLRAWGRLMFPGRRMNFLLLGMPKVGIDVEKHTDMLAEQVALDPSSRANRLVTPSCNISRIEEDIKRTGFIGLKPYRVFSSTGDTDYCRIHEFLTHEQMELANDRGLWVTMHLSRPGVARMRRTWQTSKSTRRAVIPG